MVPCAGLHQVLLNQSGHTEALIEVANAHQTPVAGPVTLETLCASVYGTRVGKADAVSYLRAIIRWNVMVTPHPARRLAPRASIQREVQLEAENLGSKLRGDSNLARGLDR